MLNQKITGLHGFSKSIGLTLGIFALFAFAFVLYLWAERQVIQTAELREQSLLLSDELRHSSDDLTRMVRTYVVTGEEKYKRHYREILAIREGKSPRPEKYEDVYWDLVVSDNKRPRPFAEASSLLDRMRQIGFTADELAKLEQAKHNSDQLTKTEYAAMALISSNADDLEASRLKAARMLNDEAYHQAKAEIMRPISDFHDMVELRTRTRLDLAKRTALTARVLLVCFGLLLVYTLWRTHRTLHAILGSSVDDLHGRIARLGKGDFSADIAVPKGMENSILADLSQTQANLARIDKERQSALKELSEAKMSAESVNRIKSEFLANMSHELRTPLNAILGYVQLLTIKFAKQKELLELVRGIEGAGRWLLSLVNDLIDLACIEAEELNLTIEPVKVKNVINDSFDIVWHLAQQKEIQLYEKFEADEELSISVDRARLRQILVNLLSNAIKYNCRNGSVTLSCVEIHDKVRITVTDTGVGIPDDKQQSLFTSFERLGREAGAVEGVGVGLMITKRLVEMLGGNIGFKSKERQGSAFWVELPKADANESHGPEAKEALTCDKSEFPLLLVEDNVVNQMVVADMLDILGYTVDVVDNGEKAVRAVAEKQYGVVLMDCNIPGVDGYEATRLIRQAEAGTGRHAPIIAVTANVLAGDREKCIDAGMDDYLPKPIEFIRLKELLEFWRNAGNKQ